MLILNPRRVTFGSAQWDHVTSVAVDRSAARLVEEWTDQGPHAAFADVPEQRVTVRVVMDLVRESFSGPRPGDQGTLTISTSPTASDAARREISAGAVVTSVRHAIAGTRATRTIELTAVSPDGAADPIEITESGGK